MKNTIIKQITSRRSFLGQSIVTMVGISTLGLPMYANNVKTTENHVRMIAYNILKCNGWPSDKVKNKMQIPDLIAKELSKYSPDIINFSECPDETLVKRIAGQLNMNYIYFPSGGNWPGAILTHYKILDSVNVPVVSGVRPEDLFTRHWGKATIQLPNQESIIVNSVHLYPHDNPESAAIRKREISEIIKSIGKEIKNNSIIVMGDLNHTPEWPEYAQWINAGFVDSFKEAGKGNGLTIQADLPTIRIDYVLARGPIAKQITESRALFEGAFRTNPSNPASFALSDHVPQFAEFKFK